MTHNPNVGYSTSPGETNQCRYCYVGLGAQSHTEHYPTCQILLGGDA